MRGDFHDDGLTPAGHVAHVDPGRVRLPRPQLLQRPAGGGVGGVLHLRSEARLAKEFVGHQTPPQRIKLVVLHFLLNPARFYWHCI